MKERTGHMRARTSKAMLKGMIGGFTAPLMIFPIIVPSSADSRPRSNVEQSFRTVGSALKQAVKKHRTHEPT